MNLRFILPISIFAVLAVISSVAMISLLNGKRDTSQLPSPLIGKQAPALVSVIYSNLSQSQTSEDLTASINKGPYLVNFFLFLLFQICITPCLLRVSTILYQISGLYPRLCDKIYDRS